MLRDWIAPVAPATFTATILRRQPWASAGTCQQLAQRFGWRALDDILGHPRCDTLVVAANRVISTDAPRCLRDLARLMRDGIGVVLRRTEGCHPVLREIATTLERDVPGEVHVQIFVTPGGTHGFGWHFDEEDVFITQLAGEKDYYFRPNTVGDGPPSPGEFARFVDETSPLGAATLVAGDFLYIPARWWHMAECKRDALSISVGVRVA